MGRTQSPASGGPDCDGAPVLVRQAEIALFAVLGDADMNRALWAIELRLRFQEIKRRADGRGARGLPGRLVLAPPQPQLRNRLLAYGPVSRGSLTGISAKAVPLGV